MSGNWLLRMVTPICLLALLCPVQSVSASEREHETVLVTAGRVEEKPRTVTQSVTVISSEEIEKNQYQDMAQLLRNYGIGMGGYSEGEGLSQIRIRGMGNQIMGNIGMTSQVLVLIDGRRASTANVSMLPMVSIDRVEILRGPAAVQYGSSAIGGVINVITKRGGKEWQGAAEVGYGSWDTWKSMGGLSGSVGPVDIAGGVQWSHQGDDYKTGKWDTLKDSAYRSKLAYVLNAGINFLDEHRLGVTLMSQSNQYMDNHGDSSNPGNPVDKGSPAYTDRYNHDVDVLYEGGYKKAGLAWKTRYFTTGDHYYYDDESGYVSDVHSRNQGAQAQLSWTGDFLSLTGGFDWLSNKYVDSGNSKNGETDNYAGFLLAKFNLFDEMLILNGGVRYDAYELKAGNENRDLNNTSFSVGAAFNPWDWLTLRANYGESFRAPTGLETCGYRMPSSWGDTIYHGNLDLKPEKGRGWDTGFEVNYKGINAGLAYFETRYDNKIVDAGDWPNKQWVNVDEALYRGLEGQASFDLGTFFDWPFALRPYLNFTHILQADDNQGVRITGVRDWEMAYGLNFSYPEYGLIADLRFVYMGYKDEGVYNYQTGTTDTKRTGGKTTADFFIQKTILDFEDKGRLSIKGEIRNIFNTYYETMYGYPQPGRSFYVGLRYDF